MQIHNNNNKPHPNATLSKVKCISRRGQVKESQPLLPRGHNPRPKHRTPDFRPLPIERVHGRLDVIFIHLVHELPHRLLRLRRGRIRRDRATRRTGRAPATNGEGRAKQRRAGPRSPRRRQLRRLVEEKESCSGGCEERGDIR